MSKTPYFTKETVERPWYVVDLEGEVFGRACTRIAALLIGKNRPEYTPGQDCGGFVVVLNADKIKVTGTKLANKHYYNHSGYPGGIRHRTLGERLEKQPEELIRSAVKGMLPHNKIGARLITKLKVYTGTDHPHQAQNPTVLSAEQFAAL
ncbi:MAG: 50S ribosomal protein L13 [Planctomycetales bacterium]|nr:50S ribosomal protein L13 [bacterium]UNM07912.1 MAG: 50S ribosomal protein L13 [Planctomycetales bacterium]